MPFNSDSYYRNKWRREAKAHIAKARELKGAPYDPAKASLYGPDYERQAVESAVRRARITWRLYLSQAAICRIKADARKAFR